MLTANGVITGAVGKALSAPSSSGATGGAAAGFQGEVVYNQIKVKGALNDGALAFTAAQTGAEGVYVPYIQDKCALGTLSGAEGFFYSDQFGGCDFTVLKDANGNWVGSHVHSSDACRSSIAAPPGSWTSVYTWRSGPYAREFGMAGSINVLCFVTRTHLNFVMVYIRGYPPKIADVRMAASVKL